MKKIDFQNHNDYEGELLEAHKWIIQIASVKQKRFICLLFFINTHITWQLYFSVKRLLQYSHFIVLRWLSWGTSWCLACFSMLPFWVNCLSQCSHAYFLIPKCILKCVTKFWALLKFFLQSLNLHLKMIWTSLDPFSTSILKYFWLNSNIDAAVFELSKICCLSFKSTIFFLWPIIYHKN